jgi:outer membrane protein assembly factor BamB
MSENNSGGWRKLLAALVTGIFVLCLLYQFRHYIVHFHLRLRFRDPQAINVSPSPSSMPRGSRKKFTAIAHYRDGSQAELISEIIWTSSNHGIVTVDSEGMAIATNQGTATLQVKYGRATAASTVTVVPVAPIALAILPTDETIAINADSQLKVWATRSDDSVEDVTNQVSWFSSTPDAVRIAPSGLAHGQALGSSTIVAELATSLGKLQTASRVRVISTTKPLAGAYVYRYDTSGTGQNRFETSLTPKNVNAATFGKLFSAAVDGYVYAQPLYVGNITVADGGSHNVIYVASEHDTVLAFDADSGAELFHTNLGSSVPTNQWACPGMGSEIGITGTPVIDPVTQTLFVAAKSLINGGVDFHLHAIDIASGKEKAGSPVLITATVPGHGRGSRHGMVTFDPEPQLQRPGLVLLNGQVIITFGSMCDRGAFHGWLLAYDSATLKQTHAFLTTPDGSHGGIWQAGASPAEDAVGDFYVIVGDGEFDAYDGGNDYGDTFLRLRFAANDAVSRIDYFTPFNQEELDRENWDLGSSGPLILPDQLGQHSHLLFGAGKDGSLYLIDRDDMGHYQSSSNNQIVQYLPRVFQTKVHVSPAYWRNATSEWVYLGPVEGQLQAFPLSRGRLSPAASSHTSTVFGYPGATPVISSNGDSNGILWALENYTGVLHAFDATNLSTELYNAKQAPNGRDAAEHGVQFYVPLVANGKVYFGTRGHLYAYGLLSKSPSN